MRSGGGESTGTESFLWAVPMISFYVTPAARSLLAVSADKYPEGAYRYIGASYESSRYKS